MDDTTVLLIPHMHLREKELGVITSRFPRLAVCLPWTMGSAFSGEAEPAGSLLEVLRPPESLRPDENFHAILKGYNDWMTRERRGDFSGFVKALQDGCGREHDRWEIGRMIRRGEADPDTTRDDALKWHLILHLARQAEEAVDEAEAMLSKLKDLASPLADALVEGDAGRALLDDLTPFSAEPSADSRHVRSILEAWMGLFRTHLPHYNTLLTMDPRIMEHLAGLFNETADPEDVGDVMDAKAVSRIWRRSFPALPENAASGEAGPARWLSGKSLILMEC